MGDVPRICQWYWSCCHFWQLIPGMNNKIIIILHQREDDQFVKSIKNWAKDCPLMRWSTSGRPYIKLFCHRCTKGPGRRGSCNAGRQGGLSWMHIYILSLISWQRRGWQAEHQGSPLWGSGCVSATIDSFPKGEGALLTISSCARKRNGINEHIIFLLENDSSLIINPE